MSATDWTGNMAVVRLGSACLDVRGSVNGGTIAAGFEVASDADWEELISETIDVAAFEAAGPPAPEDEVSVLVVGIGAEAGDEVKGITCSWGSIGRVSRRNGDAEMLVEVLPESAVVGTAPAGDADWEDLISETIDVSAFEAVGSPASEDEVSVLVEGIVAEAGNEVTGVTCSWGSIGRVPRRNGDAEKLVEVLPESAVVATAPATRVGTAAGTSLTGALEPEMRV